MKSHSVTATHKMPDGDLAQFVHGKDLGDAVDVANMIDGDCFVLHGEDALRGSLEAACQEGKRGRIVDVSIPQTGRDVEGGKCEPGHKYKLVIMISEKKDGTSSARLTHKTRAQIEPEMAEPERRQGILNLGLGVAIFAVMSVTSLAILAPPYSFAIAAGALAPAGVMLARAARKHA